MGQTSEQIFFVTKHTKVVQREMNIITSMMQGIKIFWYRCVAKSCYPTV